jgi:transmembrane sensor
MEMIPPQETIERQAIAWLMAINDPAFVDWQGWESWLADPSHSETYWRLAAREAELAEGLTADRHAWQDGLPIESRDTWRRRRIAGAAVAAATAMGLCIAGFSYLHQTEAKLVTVETKAGQPRSLRLADGTQLSLNGATRLHIDRANPRQIVLERGQVTFTVAHDPSRPFSVAVGDASINDLGTVFDVARADGALRVSVSEGSVAYVAQGQNIRVDAGNALSIAGGVSRVQAIDTVDVGGWRGGRFSYENAPLTEVATDLRRSLGVDVEVSAAARSVRFTGSFKLRGDEDAARTKLEQILGIRIALRDGKWVFLVTQGGSPSSS